MFASDTESDATVALRIRAGWCHEWRRPPPNIKVHQIVPGPFKKRLPLVENTPYYFFETKGLRRSRLPRRKRLSREMIAGQRCAVVRTGIPDPWADYLMFRGTTPGITKVSAEDQSLWSARLDLTESAWKKHGIKLTQGIPNPWESWPKLETRESGDTECPCLAEAEAEPKPLEECPCDNPAPAVEKICREVQEEMSFETKPRKTAKKMPLNTQTRKKPLINFKFWKKSKLAQPRKPVQHGWYQPQWEFAPQPGNSCGCSEVKPQTTAPKCSKTQSCECYSTKQLPIAKPSPKKCCACSEKLEPPPPPVVVQSSPERCCACLEKLKPQPVAKPPPPPAVVKPPPPPAVVKPPPPPAVVVQPSPERCCACLEKPKPPPVAKPPPPPAVVVQPSPERCCACLEKLKPQPLPVAKPPPPPPVAKPPPPPPVVKPPPQPPVVVQPVPEKCCACSEKPKPQPPPVVKPQAPTVLGSPEVLLTARHCECSQLKAPQQRVDANPSPVNHCECSLQTKIQKPPPPPRPPPPRGCDCQAPMQMQPPAGPIKPRAENDCELSGVEYNSPRVANKPSPGKSCGVTKRLYSQRGPADVVLSSAQKVKASRETGYLQSTDSPVERQDLTKTTETRSRATQCDSVECLQREILVATVEPTYLQDEAEPPRDRLGQLCSTCETSFAEVEARKLEELWKDYEKRKETQHSSKVQHEHKTVTEPSLSDIDEDNVGDGAESNAPKRSGRLGSILRSPSLEHEQGPGNEVPTKRVSISFPEIEVDDFFSAEQEAASGAKKKGGRLPKKASSGNISDVSSIARASVAGSVTSDTFLSMMNTATGTSGKSGKSRISKEVSDEEVEMAEVDLSVMEPQIHREASEHDMGSLEQEMKRSIETFDLKGSNNSTPGSLETQFRLSDENIRSLTQANSKFQSDDIWPSQGSNPSLLSGQQSHMERIEELRSRDDGQWQEDDNPNIKSASEQFEVRPDNTLDDSESRDYFHEFGESFPSDARASKDAEEPEQDMADLANYPIPTTSNHLSERSSRRFPYDKSRSSHIVGIPDLEPRHRRRCYACQMQGEKERLKIVEKKESKKGPSSDRRPISSGSRKRDEKKRARTPNYWVEKRDRGMAYYADEEAVLIADPQSVKAKVSVIPKNTVKKRERSLSNWPRDSSREKEGRNRVLLEQAVYRPKHMGKTREYDYMGGTVQGRGSGHGFPGIGMSATSETSVSGNFIEKSPRNKLAANVSASSRQDTYFPSSQNSSVGKDPHIQNLNSRSEIPQRRHSEKASNPMKTHGYLESAKSPIPESSFSSVKSTSNGYFEVQHQFTENAYSGGTAGPSNACEVCCKPSVYNLLPNRNDQSYNRSGAESLDPRKDELRQQAKSSDHSEKTRGYESESESLHTRLFQRKGNTHVGPCGDESEEYQTKRSLHMTDDRNRVMLEQEAVRPKHTGRTREYDFMASAGYHSLQPIMKQQKSEDSCTSCCKSADCLDPKHGHKGQSYLDSCDICCKTGACVSSSGSQQQSRNSHKEVLSQQESVRPQHMGKTREYELPGNAPQGPAYSQNKVSKRIEVQDASKVPPHSSAYDSNSFLVDPIKLIRPSRAIEIGPPGDIPCPCSSDEEAAESAASRRRSSRQRTRKIDSIMVTKPRRN